MTPVDGADHAETAPVEDVGVDLSGLDALVAQQFLHGSNVVSVLEQVRCKGVAESVARHLFVDVSSTGGKADLFVD